MDSLHTASVYQSKCLCEVTKVKIEQVCHIVNSLNEVMGPHAIRRIYFPNFHAYVVSEAIFWGGDTGNKGS